MGLHFVGKRQVLGLVSLSLLLIALLGSNCGGQPPSRVLSNTPETAMSVAVSASETPEIAIGAQKSADIHPGTVGVLDEATTTVGTDTPALAKSTAIPSQKLTVTRASTTAQTSTDSPAPTATNTPTAEANPVRDRETVRELLRQNKNVRYQGTIELTDEGLLALEEYFDAVIETGIFDVSEGSRRGGSGTILNPATVFVVLNVPDPELMANDERTMTRRRDYQAGGYSLLSMQQGLWVATKHDASEDTVEVRVLTQSDIDADTVQRGTRSAIYRLSPHIWDGAVFERPILVLGAADMAGSGRDIGVDPTLQGWMKQLVDIAKRIQ